MHKTVRDTLLSVLGTFFLQLNFPCKNCITFDYLMIQPDYLGHYLKQPILHLQWPLQQKAFLQMYFFLTAQPLKHKRKK